MSTQGLDLQVLTTFEDVAARGNEFTSLVKESLNVEQSLEKTLRQVNFGDSGSIIIAAIVGGEIASMNAFIIHHFSDGDETFFAFQSGFSATGSRFRGQGLWPKLLKASEDVLRDAGGRWIFGFPNAVSHPLFERKLDYRTIPMLSRRLSAIELWSLPNFVGDARFVCPDIEALSSWKLSGTEKKYLHLRDQRKAVFLKKKEKFGLALADIGAWQAEGISVNRLLGETSRECRAAFLRVEVNEGSQYVNALKLKKTSRPLIVKALMQDFPEKIDLFGGVSDTF